MAKFLLKVVIFLLSLGVLFIFPTIVIILSREYYSPEAAVTLQESHPGALYNLSYVTSFAPYKEALVAARAPVIIAAGASRSVEFRQQFFSNPDAFTNAALPGGSLEDVEASLDYLIAHNPSIKVIILSLDSEDFDPNFSRPGLDTTDNVYEWYRSGWRTNYLDYFAGKFTLSKLYERSQSTDDIGLSSLINHDGFRGDGSYQYSKILSDPQHAQAIAAQIVQSVDDINKNRYLHFGNSTSQPALDSLSRALALCKSRGVYVVGFLPPFPQQMYQAMLSKDDAYKATVLGLPQKLQNIFSAYGFGFYNFSDDVLIGASDTEFIDAGHGTDKMYLRMSMYLAEHDKALQAYFDEDAMRALLKNTNTDYLAI